MKTKVPMENVRVCHRENESTPKKLGRQGREIFWKAQKTMQTVRKTLLLHID